MSSHSNSGKGQPPTPQARIQTDTPSSLEQTLSPPTRFQTKTPSTSGTQTPVENTDSDRDVKVDKDAACTNEHLPSWRKWTVLFVTSWVAFIATFSSTSLFAAAEEIAAEFDVPVTNVFAVNGAMVFFLGCSPFVWGPIGQILGRKMAYNLCIVAMLLTSIGAALSRNWQVFVAMRLLAGFEGTFFHVTGQTILAESFAPLRRGTATGMFLSGTALGPALGPCIAGIIVNFASWRDILWLQTAMSASGVLLSFVFVPKTDLDKMMIHRHMSRDEIYQLLASANPLPTLKMLAFPNVLLTDLCAGFLSWSQYLLLAAVREVINARFNIRGSLYSGLFYIAIAAGFLLGTLLGGWWSDRTVRKWVDIRHGVRLPQDRLRAGMFSFFLVIPAAQMAYGWGLQCPTCSTDTAGIAFPAVTGFLTAAGLLSAFASVNTYCAEVIPGERKKVVATKYLIQYIFGAGASAAAVPLIKAVGPGVASTIGVVMVLLAGVLTLLTATHGSRMQRWAEARLACCRPRGDPEMPELETSSSGPRAGGKI